MMNPSKTRHKVIISVIKFSNKSMPLLYTVYSSKFKINLYHNLFYLLNCFYFQNLDIFKYALVIGLHLEVRGKGGGRGGCEVRVHSFALVTQNICLALHHSPGKGSKGRRRERERNGERLKKEKQPKVSPKHLLLSLRMIRRRGRRRNTGDFALN